MTLGPSRSTSSPSATNDELARVVRTWRLRLTSEDVPEHFAGSTARRSRVSQEKIAAMSGSSSHWYRRLEQGNTGGYSDDFLDRVAGALRLSSDEKHLLFLLATGRPSYDDAPNPRLEATPAIRRIVEEQPWPAFIHDESWKVLVWNKPALDWFPWLSGSEDNMMRWILTRAEARRQLHDWENSWAKPALAQIRFAHARHPDDRRLPQLITEILDENPEVQGLWQHPVTYPHADGAHRKLYLPTEHRLQPVEIVEAELRRAPGSSLVMLVPLPDDQERRRPASPAAVHLGSGSHDNMRRRTPEGRMPDERQLARIDRTKPHPARRYNYWLGGKDNFAADRESGDAIAKAMPSIKTAARENRRFLKRSVRYLSHLGITQFLDIGTGLPTAENTHEVARDVNPDARVVYADNDPLVLAHARALLDGATAYLDADLRDTKALLANPVLRETLDLTQPVGLMLVAILHFIRDDEYPRLIIDELVASLAPGSYLVASHATWDYFSDEKKNELRNHDDGGRFNARTLSQFTAMLDGFSPVEPGIVPVSRWRRDDSEPLAPPDKDVSCYGAVARIR